MIVIIVKIYVVVIFGLIINILLTYYKIIILVSYSLNCHFLINQQFVFIYFYLLEYFGVLDISIDYYYCGPTCVTVTNFIKSYGSFD